jgi:hypothetical protein
LLLLVVIFLKLSVEEALIKLKYRYEGTYKFLGLQYLLNLKEDLIIKGSVRSLEDFVYLLFLF